VRFKSVARPTRDTPAMDLYDEKASGIQRQASCVCPLHVSGSARAEHSMYSFIFSGIGSSQ